MEINHSDEIVRIPVSCCCLVDLLNFQVDQHTQTLQATLETRLSGVLRQHPYKVTEWPKFICPGFH